MLSTCNSIQTILELRCHHRQRYDVQSAQKINSLARCNHLARNSQLRTKLPITSHETRWSSRTFCFAHRTYLSLISQVPMLLLRGVSHLALDESKGRGCAIGLQGICQG